MGKEENVNSGRAGEHVSYAVEAFPEDNQCHLSAESAFYVRAVTEGLFCLRPTGLNEFELNPRLPADWKANGMSLKNISIAGTTVDVRVMADSCEVTVRVRKPKRHPLGIPFRVSTF